MMPDEFWPSTHLTMLIAVRNPTDSPAWTAFVERYRTPIVQFCQQRLRLQTSESEDVAQDVLLKLIRAMHKFTYNPQKSFRAWLKTVTKNAAYDYLKSEKARLDVAAGDSQVHERLQRIPDAAIADELTSVLEESLMRDLLAEAERIVRARVDPSTSQAYELRHRGTPAREVAQQLNMKIAAVHKAYSRVKQMLREEVASLLNQPRTVQSEKRPPNYTRRP
jgi:RNA polymerase sigma-70 factor (ECF subfamily)